MWPRVISNIGTEHFCSDGKLDARALTVEVVVEFPPPSFGHSSLLPLFSDDVEFTMATSATLRFTLRQ